MSLLFSMARFQDLNEQLEGLKIEDEENIAVVLESEEEEGLNKYDLCLVGRFLTEKTINVRAMKTKLADIWKLISRSWKLVYSYSRDDMIWVMNGGPWQFDNAMLSIDIIPHGEDPLTVSLGHLNIWIQIHDLPSALMTEPIGKQLGDFFGEFLEYDQKNNTSIWRECMRLRIRLDVRKPLKRKKKITRRNGADVVVNCKYERLGDFCFYCGFVTHTERFCRKLLDKRSEETSREWGSWLRAPPRRVAGQPKSRWLRDEGDVDWEARKGRDNNIPQSGGSGYDRGGNQGIQKSNSSYGMHGNRNLIQLKDKGPMTAVTSDLVNKSNHYIGPDEDELSGLNIVERKRPRGGLGSYDTMDTKGHLQRATKETSSGLITEATLSGRDCVVSSENVLATLALQASQSK